MGISSTRVRIFWISLIFIVLFLSAVGRLFYLQIIKGHYYTALAQGQQAVESELEPARGNIYLALPKASKLENNIPLALTRTWYDVWISPKEILQDEREAISLKLSELLELDLDLIQSRVNKENDPYEPLKNKIDKKVIAQLEVLNYKGVHWSSGQDRYYPLGNFASQLVGFVGRADSFGQDDNKEVKIGQYGLEGFYDDNLKGSKGYVAGFKKALGSLILPLSQITKAKKGQDLYLTLDYNIQLTAEEELKKAVEKYQADSASVIVLDAKNGAILAMAAWPGFDPNKYNEVKDPSLFLNPNIQSIFEPGSIFKPITMAAALDINVVSPDLTYQDTGEVKIGPHTIVNSTHKAWGTQTMTQVLEKSLNTGAIFVLRRMPLGVWREYVNKFGLGEKTGIDLAGEVKGDIKNLKSSNEIDWLTSAFGQGVAVTPIEMVSAIGAVANGGELLKPYLVDRIMDENNAVVFKAEKVVKRRVIKLESAQALIKMLMGVVENGSGKQARIPGYSVAGKTGTAQEPSPQGDYSEKTIHTFVGFSPAFDPAFVMLVKLNHPRASAFSEATAAPVFKNIGEFILHYLEVKPDRPI